MNKKFSVETGKNSALIKISGQNYTNIYDENKTIVFSDRSQTNEVNAILEPGNYEVESDGEINSIDIKLFDMGEHKDE